MIQKHIILKGACLTEKSTGLGANLNKYVFEVSPEATKNQIKNAIESVYQVKVTKVNTINKSGKTKRSKTQRNVYGKTKNVTKAIISVNKGEKIELV